MLRALLNGGEVYNSQTPLSTPRLCVRQGVCMRVGGARECPSCSFRRSLAGSRAFSTDFDRRYLQVDIVHSGALYSDERATCLHSIMRAHLLTASAREITRRESEITPHLRRRRRRET